MPEEETIRVINDILYRAICNIQTALDRNEFKWGHSSRIEVTIRDMELLRKAKMLEIPTSVKDMDALPLIVEPIKSVVTLGKPFFSLVKSMLLFREIEEQYRETGKYLAEYSPTY